MQIEKALLAQVVKNTSLRYWYPEGRELPNEDPYKRINPWYDEIFKVDLPQLEELGLIETGGQKPSWVRLTEIGKFFVAMYSDLNPYLKFRKEVFQLNEESRRTTFFPRKKDLYDHLIHRSKSLSKDEALLYDYPSLNEKFPLGFVIEPDKITSYIDVKSWLSAILERIKRDDVLRAPHEKSQWHFLIEVCKKFMNTPLKEKPLIEICGLCVNAQVDNSHIPTTTFTLQIQGQTVLVIATNFSIEPLNVEYHSLRVIGVPSMARGFIRIQAMCIFDRGKYFPSDSRAF
ncbi:MAG: hypothetical protein QXP38_04130 [Nitrososphaerota archaeon]